MLKAIILDDEQENINGLILKLQRVCPEVEVVWSTTEPLLALKHILEIEADILFLDVEMPEMNGFNFLKALSRRTFEVIMVTAYSDYAIKAFKADALDYLLKPVDIDELRAAVNKVQLKKSINSQLENRIEKLSGIISKQQPGKIALHGAKEIHFVQLSQIIRIEGENNYSIFYLANGQKIIVTKTLKDYEETLKEQNFFRIHKSHIINMDYLVKLNKADNHSVVMSDGSEIEISIRRKADFLKMLSGE